MIPRQEEFVAVLDFGSQYAQLIARRVREKGVYSVIYPYNVPAETLRKARPSALIFSGGPASTLTEDSPRPDPAVFDLDVPILGICYGLQVAVLHFGGNVVHAKAREYGRTELEPWDSIDGWCVRDSEALDKILAPKTRSLADKERRDRADDAHWVWPEDEEESRDDDFPVHGGS